MMKYRKTGKFKLGFLTLLLSVLFVACGSGASDADRQIKSKTDLKQKTFSYFGALLHYLPIKK